MKSKKKDKENFLNSPFLPVNFEGKKFTKRVEKIKPILETHYMKIFLHSDSSSQSKIMFLCFKWMYSQHNAEQTREEVVCSDQRFIF